MKKIITVVCICAVLTAAVSAAPEAAVSAAPAAEVISPHNVMYSETITSPGTLSFVGQSEMTSALPLVIERFTVSEGDHVTAGDTIAIVDREGSASFLESLGQLPQLAVAAANLSTAAALIPEAITADRSGRILSVAGTGAGVEAGSSIASVASTDDLIITAPVSEQYISQIYEGMSVRFTLTALPEELFYGTVSVISSAAHSRYSGSVLETVVDVTVTPNNYDERFKTGLSADVTFTVTEPREICVLSYEAIGQDEGGEYVYIYENGKACRRKIFTGVEFSDGTEIIKGVTAEDSVFVSPEKLSDSPYIRMEQE
ncbi:MAG: HlyD family efflux transporter periplasmic adaptor subunit [Oscillospiraceae bacterium]|nr:HlyD family efflux transporter periplasmic adaptor subunit [Oscillospiraceae bacterium]